MARPDKPADPTAERTADQSTRSASGLTGGWPDRDAQPHPDLAQDLVARTRAERHTTPRRYEKDADEPTMPADASTMNTKI